MFLRQELGVMEPSENIVQSDLSTQICCNSEIILEKIFSHLSYQELQQTRLVCRIWKSESDRVIKKRDNFVFLSNEKSIRKMSDKIAELKETKSYIIFNKFAMVFEEISLESPVAKEFFDRHGSCITQLRIRFGLHTSASQNTRKSFKKLLGKQVPNLESLLIFGVPEHLWMEDDIFDENKYDGSSVFLLPKLKSLGLFTVDGYEHSVECPLYVNLLSCLPSVEKFSVNCANFLGVFFAKAFSSRWNRMRQFFWNVVEFSTIYGHSKSKLTQGRPENCQPITDTNCLYALLELCPKIIKLRLCLGNQVQKSAFENLMTKLSSQLIELELSDHYRRYSVLEDTRIPEFNHREIDLSKVIFTQLRVLKVKETIFLPARSVGKLLAKNFPTLKMLKVKYDQNMFRKTAWEDPHFHPLPSLIVDGLTLRGPDTYSLRHYGIAFPALKSLKINVPNDNVLREVFENFPDLEELEIIGGYSDEGITGIPQNVCNAYCHTIGPTSVPDPYFSVPYRSGMYIGDLKYLRKLRLVSNLSSVSALYGIAELKQLTSLYIEFSWINDLPIRGMFLMPMLNLLDNLVKLEVSPVYLHHIENINAIKNKVYLRCIPDRARYLV